MEFQEANLAERFQNEEAKEQASTEHVCRPRFGSLALELSLSCCTSF